MAAASMTGLKDGPFRRLPVSVVSTEELALCLRCSRRTIERLVRRGVLRPMRVGRCWRFDHAEVVETLAADPVR